MAQYRTFADIGRQLKQDYLDDPRIQSTPDEQLGQKAYQKHPEEYPDFNPGAMPGLAQAPSARPAPSIQPAVQSRTAGPAVSAPPPVPPPPDRNFFDVPISEYPKIAYDKVKEYGTEAAHALEDSAIGGTLQGLKGAARAIPMLPYAAALVPGVNPLTIKKEVDRIRPAIDPTLQAASSSAYRVAERVNKEYNTSQLKKSLAPAPGFEDSWTRKLAGGVGSTLPIMGTAMVAGPGAATALAFSMGAGEIDKDIDEFEQKTGTKVSDENRQIAAGLGGIVGMLDSYVPGKMVKPLAVAAKGFMKRGADEAAKKAAFKAMEELANTQMQKTFKRQLLETMAFEGGQEGVQELGNNLIARGWYNKDKSLMDNVVDSILIGAFTGGVLEHAIGHPARKILQASVKIGQNMAGKGSKLAFDAADSLRQSAQPQSQSTPNADAAGAAQPQSGQQPAPEGTVPAKPAFTPAPDSFTNKNGETVTFEKAPTGTGWLAKDAAGDVIARLPNDHVKQTFFEQQVQTESAQEKELRELQEENARLMQQRDLLDTEDAQDSPLTDQPDTPGPGPNLDAAPPNVRDNLSAMGVGGVTIGSQPNPGTTGPAVLPGVPPPIPRPASKPVSQQASDFVDSLEPTDEELARNRQAQGLEPVPPPPGSAPEPVPSVEPAPHQTGGEVDPNAVLQPETKYKKASTQVNITGRPAAKILKAGNAIAESDLTGNGRETEPHVTVQYGLPDNESIHAVTRVLQHVKPFEVTIGDTSLFPDSGDGEVVKMDVHSPELHDAKEAIKKAIPGLEDTYPNYQPHVTLGYVKPGTGQKYVGPNGATGTKVKVKSIAFSTLDGQHFEIPLGSEVKKTGSKRKPVVVESAPVKSAPVKSAQTPAPESTPAPVSDMAVPEPPAPVSQATAPEPVPAPEEVKASAPVVTPVFDEAHIQRAKPGMVKKGDIVRVRSQNNTGSTGTVDHIKKIGDKEFVVFHNLEKRGALTTAEVGDVDIIGYPSLEDAKAIKERVSTNPTSSEPIHVPLAPPVGSKGPVTSQVQGPAYVVVENNQGEPVKITRDDSGGDEMYHVTTPEGTQTLDSVDAIEWAHDNLEDDHLDAAMGLINGPAQAPKAKPAAPAIQSKSTPTVQEEIAAQPEIPKPTTVSVTDVAKSILSDFVQEHNSNRAETAVEAGAPDATDAWGAGKPHQVAEAIFDSGDLDLIKGHKVDAMGVTIGLSNITDARNPGMRIPGLSASEVVPILEQMYQDGLLKKTTGRGRGGVTEYTITQKGINEALQGHTDPEASHVYPVGQETTGPAVSTVPKGATARRRGSQKGAIPVNVQQVRQMVSGLISNTAKARIGSMMENIGLFLAMAGKSGSDYVAHRYGREGQIFSDMLEHANFVGELLGGRELKKMQSVITNKALINDQNAMLELHDLMTGRIQTSANPDVMSAFKIFREATDTVAARAMKLKVMVQSPSGKRLPFAKHLNYIPITYNYEALKLNTPLRKDVVANMLRQGWVSSEAEAHELIQETVDYMTKEDPTGAAQPMPHKLMAWAQQYGGYHGRTLNQIERSLQRYRASLRSQNPGAIRHSSLEYMRKTRLPVYDPNMFRVMPSNTVSAHTRLSIIEGFGQDNQLQEMLQKMVTMRNGNSQAFVKDMNTLLGQRNSAQDTWSKALALGRRYSSLKLAFATFPNSLQPLNILAVTNPAVFQGALAQSYTQYAVDLAIESGAISESILNDAAMGYSTGQGVAEISKKMLEWNGFLKVESNNRQMAAVAGVKWANHNLAIIQAEAAKLGMTADQYMATQRLTGKVKDAATILHDFFKFELKNIGQMADMGMTKMEQLRSAKVMSDYTQFRSDTTSIPIWANTDTGKAIWMFKHFAYHQSKFFADLLTTALKGADLGGLYSAARGKGKWDGNKRQMLRGLWGLVVMGAISPAMGAVVSQLKNLVVNHEWKKFNSEMARVMDAFSAGGSLGMYIDMLMAQEKDDSVGMGLLKYAAGPVGATVINAADTATGIYQHSVGKELGSSMPGASDRKRLVGDVFRTLNSELPIVKPFTNFTKNWLDVHGYHPGGTAQSNLRGRATYKSGQSKIKGAPSNAVPAYR